MPDRKEKYTAAWSSPSNIALVKYWGKRPVQLPASPSVSLTLDKARTTTKVEFRPGREIGFRIRIDGKESEAFDLKTRTFLERIGTELDLVDFGFLDIESSNTFPHSSGIASSASGLSALALCLSSIDAAVKGKEEGDQFMLRASHLARLGSGSACRSVYGPLAVWGSHIDMPGSHDEYACPMTHGQVHPVFRTYRDAILVLSTGQKKVSSSRGHALMEEHPYLQGRLAQAERNMSRMIDVIGKGDLDGFVRVVEEEALSLHALMMSSDPGFILMSAATLEVIEKIRTFREQSGLHLCFTLDAGPNVHLLYPAHERELILPFIREELLRFCEDQYWIDDQVGMGPQRLDNE